MEHGMSKDRAWFHNLYKYMISVLDKCKEIGYNAYEEVKVMEVR